MPQLGHFLLKERVILKFLLSGIDLWILAFILLGAYLALIDNKKPLYALLIGLILGSAEFFYHMSDEKGTNLAVIAFNRYLIITTAVLLLLFSILSLIMLAKKNKFLKFSLPLSMISTTTIFFYLMPRALKMTGEFIYFGEDGFSTMALLRVIGFVLALVISALVTLGLYKVLRALKGNKIYLYFTIIVSTLMVDYVVRAVSALQRLRFIKLNDFVFQIMIFGDNHYRKIIYFLILVLTLALISVYFSYRKVTGEFKNSALRRKQIANFRNKRRWSIELFTFLMIALFTLTVVRYYETKEVELAPAEEYTMEENKIIVDLEALADGHLHRFSYVTPNGYDVRFIAVKKPKGTAYGVGLDACEICGIAGYFERGDDVVCKRCDVVMNKATIGFKGGCNPIPFPYEIANQKIYINIDDLIREEKRFR